MSPKPFLPSRVASSLACVLALAPGWRSQSGAVPGPAAPAPTVILREAPLLEFRGANSPDARHPGETDCNSPAHWDGPTLYLFNSAGHPWRSAGPDLFHLDQIYARSEYNNQVNGGRWIEATWKARDGVLYGWYHNEPGGLCPGTHLTAPKIGALRSTNNGAAWQDLGVILEARTHTLRCDTKNFYFAGGNGDFSVMVDLNAGYVYFFISTYAGDPSEQGVAVARMRYWDRDRPVGKVWKWHADRWSEPGLGGRVTPIFPATRDWHRAGADAFWGPSIHWNTHLGQYVILLNRARDENWTQEGVYVTFNPDLAHPRRWSRPRKILGGLRKDEWYPQVMGLDASRHETDKLAGARARLFVRGQSRWEIEFAHPGWKENARREGIRKPTAPHSVGQQRRCQLDRLQAGLRLPDHPVDASRSGLSHWQERPVAATSPTGKLAGWKPIFW